VNRATLLEIYAAAIEALGRWEPRLRVTKVQASSAVPGSITLDITADYLPDGKPVTLEGIVVN